jgi:hypothetical protein
MVIKLICPRCKTGLQVPTKLLGQYTQCPACQNRILIPPQAPPGSIVSDGTGDTEAGRSATAAISLPAYPGAGAGQSGSAPAADGANPAQNSAAPGRGGTPAAAPSVRAAWANTPQQGSTNASASQGAAGRSVTSMPAAAWSGHAAADSAPTKKVARFITADSAPSTVQLAPGGELPKLQLAEGAPSKKGPGAAKMNPLVIVGAACLSFCMCVVLLLYDFDSLSIDGSRDARVRRDLESYYKNQEGPLQPYQVQLREAQQARSRGDHLAEQRHYRKVLDLLRAERDPRDRFRGLTGTPQSDQKLEKMLASLLAGTQAEVVEEGN